MPRRWEPHHTYIELEPQEKKKTHVIWETARRYAQLVGAAWQCRYAAPLGTAPHVLYSNKGRGGLFCSLLCSGSDGARGPPPPRGAFWIDQLWLVRGGRLNELSVLIIKNTLTKSTALYAGPVTGRVISASPMTWRLKSGGHTTWRAASARCMTWRATTAMSTMTTNEPIKRKTNKDV